MELSPVLYRRLIRPNWVVKRYISNILGDSFDFNNKKVLDFGCGIGTSSCLFDSDKYIGLDPDYRRIAYARRLYPNYRFYRLEGRFLPIPDHHVDYIFIVSVLHHITEEEAMEFLKEFRRILKHNGQILVMEPCFFSNSHISNRFMVLLDNGKYIRTMNGYMQLFVKLGYKIHVTKKYKQLIFYSKLFFVASR
jgi:ubiquinone/menaquinone biosynthesis C-methylase UbiE